MGRFFRISVVLLLLLPGQAAWALALTVKLEGLDKKLEDQVLTYLDISHEQGTDSKLSLAQLQRLNDLAPQQIKTALQVFGYFRARVNSDLRQSGNTWLATNRVEPGAQIRLTHIDVAVNGPGRDNPALKKAVATFPVRQGQALDQPAYDAARDALFRTAIRQGFLDARFVKRELKVNLAQYVASISLQLQTGQRYYFGPVTFHQSSMNQKFLFQYVTFQPGDPYDPGKLLQLQTALSDSSLFQSVEVSPDKARARDMRVPIDITLTPRKRHQWRFGLGYATDTGPRGSINYSQLVGSHGDRFETRLLKSQITKSVSVGYTIPLADPINDQLSLGVRYSDEIVEGRESVISRLSASQSSLWDGWQRVISLNYDREVYTISGEPEATGRALYPVFSLTRIRADNRIDTRNGYRLDFEVRGGNKNLLSDTNYGQIRMGLKWIHSLNADSRLILRGDFGSTNVAYLDELPLSQRFFAGGDNSVRGYAYNSLGPKDSFGHVVGGKHLIVGSVQYNHRIAGNWSGALFYDIGNAVNSMGDPLVAGTGFGLRWDSPVGPVRIDFAWALDKPTDRFRLHVVIGPDL
ncbi:MAG: autotransporter assembly complex protein TamA [Gammaproteobacteria bacterium]